MRRTRKGYAASVSGKAANGCAIARSKRKGRFFAALRCSGPPRGRGSPESVPARPVSLLPARAGPLLFPGLAPRVRWGGKPRWKIEWPLLLKPLPLYGPVKGLSSGRTRRSAPTGEQETAIVL